MLLTRYYETINDILYPEGGEIGSLKKIEIWKFRSNDFKVLSHMQISKMFIDEILWKRKLRQKEKLCAKDK